MSDEIGRLLRRLESPAPPSTLAPVVMARIAREANRDTSTGTARDRNNGSRHAWLWMLTGFAVVVGVTLNGWRGGVFPPVLVSWPIGINPFGLVPAEGLTVLLLAIGLLLYVAGLFAPLRR